MPRDALMKTDSNPSKRYKKEKSYLALSTMADLLDRPNLKGDINLHVCCNPGWLQRSVNDALRGIHNPQPGTFVPSRHSGVTCSNQINAGAKQTKQLVMQFNPQHRRTCENLPWSLLSQEGVHPVASTCPSRDFHAFFSPHKMHRY